MALITTAILAANLPAPSVAGADGLPIANVNTTRTGISDRDGLVSYFAVPAPGDAARTQLLRVADEPDENGRALTMRTLEGTLAVPGVAWDGTTSGLTSLGGRLVLIEPRESFPRRSTRLVMVDATSLRTVAELDLKGDYSFDAVSPDGGLIYLVHYVNPRDPSVYEVRAWDVAAERMLPEPIIDRRTAPEVMRGYPMTRATSPDGEWEYTLYDGGGSKPFVHALNTASKTALCIDLPSLDGRAVWNYGLEPSPDGSAVGILNRKGFEVASFTTSDWVARESDPRVSSADGGGAGSEDGGESGESALTWIVAGGALFTVLVASWLVRRRRRDEEVAAAALPDDPFAEPAEAPDRQRTPGR